MLFLDLADDDGPAATRATLDRLKIARRELVPPATPPTDDPAVYQIPTLLIANKSDDEAADIRLEIAREEFGTLFPVHVVSAERGDGLDALRKALYDVLGVMRIYTKQPGKPADMTSPFTPPIGSTVAEFAGKVHRDLEDAVKSARVWGTAVHDGQTVGRDHVLHDKDVVELHTVTRNYQDSDHDILFTNRVPRPARVDAVHRRVHVRRRARRFAAATS